MGKGLLDVMHMHIAVSCDQDVCRIENDYGLAAISNSAIILNRLPINVALRSGNNVDLARTKNSTGDIAAEGG